jgi:SAM-dependent methyltransferase
MWYWLSRFEGLFFLVPFLIYARLRRITCYVRCLDCHSLLLNYELLHGGLCEKCLKAGLRADPARVYALRSETGASPVNYGEGHLYETVVRKISAGRVIDVGCGRAPLLARLSPDGRELHGIDIAPEALKSSRKRHPGINFYIGDIRYLPFKSDTFDYLACVEVLEHIEKDELARECYRTLKPGGTALFTVPNGKGISGREPEHLRFFSFQSLVKSLEDAGFEVVSWRKFGLYIPFLTRISGTLASVLQRGLPLSHPINIPLPESLATHFFVECRKPAA